MVFDSHHRATDMPSEGPDANLTHWPDLTHWPAKCKEQGRIIGLQCFSHRRSLAFAIGMAIADRAV